MLDLMSVETSKLVCLMKALLYTSYVFSTLWSRAGIPAGKTTSHQLNMFRLLLFFLSGSTKKYILSKSTGRFIVLEQDLASIIKVNSGSDTL